MRAGDAPTPARPPVRPPGGSPESVIEGHAHEALDGACGEAHDLHRREVVPLAAVGVPLQVVHREADEEVPRLDDPGFADGDFYVLIVREREGSEVRAAMAAQARIVLR